MSSLLTAKEKRPSKSLGKSVEIQLSKKSKQNRYNKYFTVHESDDSLPKESDVELATKVQKKSSTDDSNDCTQNAQNLLSNEKLEQMFDQISAVNKVVSKQLQSACEKLRAYRTKSTLGIRETKISDDDIPLLTIFEKYNLPLKTKEEVDALEAELKNSNDFLKFFVSTELYLIFVVNHQIKNRP